MSYNNDLKLIIYTHGKRHQIYKTLEELEELQIALNRYMLDMPLTGHSDAKDVLEEIADVEIMLDQLKIIFGNNDLVDRIKERKIARTLKRSGLIVDDPDE